MDKRSKEDRSLIKWDPFVLIELLVKLEKTLSLLQLALANFQGEN